MIDVSRFGGRGVGSFSSSRCCRDEAEMRLDHIV